MRERYKNNHQLENLFEELINKPICYMTNYNKKDKKDYL